MSRQKKTSSHLTKASVRLAALKSIDDKMDLDNGLTVPKYEIAINELHTKLEEYNTMLSQVDEKMNLFQEAERAIKHLSQRMLIGVANKYGNDSNEYEKAGGVKKSERKRPKRKPKAA